MGASGRFRTTGRVEELKWSRLISLFLYGEFLVFIISSHNNFIKGRLGELCKNPAQNCFLNDPLLEINHFALKLYTVTINSLTISVVISIIRSILYDNAPSDAP